MARVIGSAFCILVLAFLGLVEYQTFVSDTHPVELIKLTLLVGLMSLVYGWILFENVYPLLTPVVLRIFSRR